MAVKDDVIKYTLSGLQQHISRRFRGAPLGTIPGDNTTTWPDGTVTQSRRKRSKGPIEQNPKDLIRYRILDGVRTDSNWQASWKYYLETLDMLLGKDPQGLWVGGPFASAQTHWYAYPTRWWSGKPYSKLTHYHRYMPPFLGTPGPNHWFTPKDADPDQIANLIQFAMGQVQGARNSARPDATYADYAVSIGELREVADLVRIKGKTLTAAIGSAYLAVEFGWKPLLGDLKKLLEFSVNIRKRLNFLKANEGRPISRKRRLFNYTETVPSTGQFTVGLTNPSWGVAPLAGTYDIPGTLTAVGYYHSKLRYALPDVDDLGWDDKAYRHLLGLTLDPSLAWELAPWSWLIDWFSNIGDFIENRWANRLADITILDEWVTINATFTSRLVLPTVAGPSASTAKPYGSAISERVDTFKWRGIPTEVAPLWWGDPLGLTSRQQAILAALLAVYSKR